MSEDRFERLYVAHASAIRSYCQRRLGPDDGADAAADVFVVVWRRLEDCPRGAEARLWIYGIARNTVANRRRKGARNEALLHRMLGHARGVDDGPEPIVVRRSEYRELDAALQKLPSKYREVLMLAEWDGLDRESIARLEDVSRSAIDKRISRAYRMLARSMNHRPAATRHTEPPLGALEEGGEI